MQVLQNNVKIRKRLIHVYRKNTLDYTIECVDLLGLLSTCTYMQKKTHHITKQKKQKQITNKHKNEKKKTPIQIRSLAMT